MRPIKGALAALALTTMAAAPAIAQSADSLSVQRAGAEMQDESELRGGFIIPLIAIVAVILGIIAAVGGDDDLPHSP